MRKAELVRFKKIFIDQRDQILKNISVLDDALMVVPDENKDEVDQATNGVEQGMRMQLKSRENQTLKMINEALRRIELGQYGDCMSCGDSIEVKRLKARPTASLCISCKEEEEKLNATAILGYRSELVH